MVEPNQRLKTLTGRGIVSAEGCAAVRVRYRVLVERRSTGLVAYGTFHGPHAALRPLWLEPDARLRLNDGRRLDVSLTDLEGDVADFESVGPVEHL